MRASIWQRWFPIVSWVPSYKRTELVADGVAAVAVTSLMTAAARGRDRCARQRGLHRSGFDAGLGQ
jgi:hypothetical protein